MSAPVRLSVLVPVYNEVATVRTLLERVRAVPLPKEVIVVDDCSTDGTTAVLEEYRTEISDTPDFRLVVLRHDRNRGKGAAIRSAVGHMTGNIAVIQDADLEYDPREYPRLIQPIVDGYADVVYGSRFSGSPRRVLLFWHMVGNRFLTLLSNMCTNLNLSDMETCYKVFKADILRRPHSLRALRARARLTAGRPPALPHLRDPDRVLRAGVLGGKKIGWKDAATAVWTILRFTLRPDVGREDAGYTTLRRVEVLRRYNGFLWDLMQPSSGGASSRWAREPASSPYLSTRERVLATELDRSTSSCSGARSRTRRTSRCGRSTWRTGRGRGPLRSFDTVVCSDVLEQLEDDAAALSAMREVLSTGGRVVLIVPALQALDGSVDRAIHHHRRYSRDDLTAKLDAAGLAVEHLSYFNMVGVPGWYLNARVLKRRSVPGFQARINDWLVPWLRVERHFGPPVGMSLLAIARAR